MKKEFKVVVYTKGEEEVDLSELDIQEKLMEDNDYFVDVERKKRIKQCCSCEAIIEEVDKDNSCPFCQSGNWVYGYIDDEEKHKCDLCGDYFDIDEVISTPNFVLCEKDFKEIEKEVRG